MSSLVGKVHAQVLYLFCCVFLINLLFFGRLHRFFCWAAIILVIYIGDQSEYSGGSGVLQPGRPPAFELRKRYLYPSQNQRPFGHWRESNPRISLSYNYYIVVPFCFTIWCDSYIEEYPLFASASFVLSSYARILLLYDIRLYRTLLLLFWSYLI